MAEYFNRLLRRTASKKLASMAEVDAATRGRPLGEQTANAGERQRIIEKTSAPVEIKVFAQDIFEMLRATLILIAGHHGGPAASERGFSAF